MKGFRNFIVAVVLVFLTTSWAMAQGAKNPRPSTQDDAGNTSNQQQTDPQPPRPQRTQQQRPGTGVTPVQPLSEEDTRRIEAARQRRQREATTGDPDVLLDIPNVSVQEITLEVDNLFAHLSLDARLANLLQLTAGVDVKIDKVKLTIKGVRAEALLKVKLNNVAEIIDRTLTTIDRNPQLLERLLQTVDKTVSTVGEVGKQAVGAVGQTLNNVTQPGGLLTQTVNTLGQTVQRTLDTTGNIVERTLDNTGKLVNERSVGNLSSLTNLTLLNESTNSAGQTVRRVRDASGAVIEIILDTAGKIVNSRVVSQGNR